MILVRLRLRFLLKQIHVIYVDNTYTLRERIYNLMDGSWEAGKLQEQKLEVHRHSNLASLQRYALYYQDPSGNIQRVEMDFNGDWSEPLRLDGPEPSFAAKVGSQLSEVPEDPNRSRPRTLWYETSSNQFIRVVNEPSGRPRERGILEMPHIQSAMVTAQPFVDELSSHLVDFVFVHCNNDSPVIVFRTADSHLNLARRRTHNSKISHTYWELCETMPSSRFFCKALYFNGDDKAAILFFISPDAKLKMMQIGLDQSPDNFLFPRRTVFPKDCRQGMWMDIIRYRPGQSCPCAYCNSSPSSDSSSTSLIS